MQESGAFSLVGLLGGLSYTMMNPTDAVFCHTCLMAFKLKRMKTSMRADPAFVSSVSM